MMRYPRTSETTNKKNQTHNRTDSPHKHTAHNTNQKKLRTQNGKRVTKHRYERTPTTITSQDDVNTHTQCDVKQAATTNQRTNCNNEHLRATDTAKTTTTEANAQNETQHMLQSHTGTNCDNATPVRTHSPQQHNNTCNDSIQARKPHLTGQMQKQNTRSCRFNSPPTPVSHQDRGAPEILRQARTNRTALERPEKTHSNATHTYRCGQKRHTTTVKWST